MDRYCFFCGKPLTVRERSTVFCGLRCQALQRDLERQTRTSTPQAPGSSEPAALGNGKEFSAHTPSPRAEGPLRPARR